MTKYYDWKRYKEMSPRQKAGVTTESTFSEQRAEEKKRPSKDFGIKQMEEEVNIDWGKAVQSESVYAEPRRAMQKLAAADLKAEELAEDNQELEEADSATKHQ